MAKKKKEEGLQEMSSVSNEQDLVKSVSYKIDKVLGTDEFGKQVTKLKHSIFEFTIDKSSDTIVSTKTLVETKDAMEAMTVFQTSAGKLILDQKNKEHN